MLTGASTTHLSSSAQRRRLWLIVEQAINPIIAGKYPITYDEEVKKEPHIIPSILDIGCGYGGLMCKPAYDI